MSHVVGLLSLLVVIGLYTLGVLAFVAGLLFVSIITRHWRA